MKKTPNIKKSPKKAIKNKPLWLIGIDEVGRGPLAGPVTVCAFGIKFNNTAKKTDSNFRKLIEKKYAGIKLNDSKKLSPNKREEIDRILRKENYKFFIKSQSAKQIDSEGISVCIRKLIKNLLENFRKSLDILEDQFYILLDGGLYAPPEFIHQETHIKGDAKFAVISCASILAKVQRDAYMTKLFKKNKALSVYKFDIHKGYGTKLHIKAIKKNGLSGEHRRSFCSKL